MAAPSTGRRRPEPSNLTPEEYSERFRRQYAAGETPWDIGVPAPELTRRVEAGEFAGRTVLEMGCGTGTNSIELARRGYRVTAVDFVPLAVEKAKEKARASGVQVDFRVGDLTRLELGGPFDCLLDIGLYHVIRNRDLPGFQATLRRASRPGTRWLSMAGSANDPMPEGPPVVSEAEFRAELEPLFEILDAHEFRYSLGADFVPLFWSILMERR
jgi:methyl halide transferase